MSYFVEILEDLAPLLTVVIVGFLIILIIRTAVIRMLNKSESRSEDSALVQSNSESNSESNEDDSGEDDSNSKYMINVINAIGFQSSDLNKKVRIAAQKNQNSESKRMNKKVSESIEINQFCETHVESTEEVQYVFCTSAYEETPFANISLDDRPSIKMLHSHHNKLIASFPMEYRELQRKCLQSNFFKLALRIEIFFFMFNGLLEEYSYDLLQMLIYLRFTDIPGAPKVTLINRTEYDELNEIVENLQGQKPDAWGQITDEDLLFKNFQPEDKPNVANVSR